MTGSRPILLPASCDAGKYCSDDFLSLLPPTLKLEMIKISIFGRPCCLMGFRIFPLSPKSVEKGQKSVMQKRHKRLGIVLSWILSWILSMVIHRRRPNDQNGDHQQVQLPLAALPNFNF
jgi:hypothetical protein